MRRYRATHQITLFIYFISVFMRHIHQLKIGSASCAVCVCTQTKHNPSPASHLLCVSEFYYLLLFYLRHHFCSTATSHHPPALTSD